MATDLIVEDNSNQKVLISVAQPHPWMFFIHGYLPHPWMSALIRRPTPPVSPSRGKYLLRIPRNGINLIPWMISSIHPLHYPNSGDPEYKTCATCATNLQPCMMRFASHWKNLGLLIRIPILFSSCLHHNYAIKC